ncbi:adenosine deaminase [Streptomyces sp. NPDC051597]|uniref:adenosine deaminase n=1 Tax=Streptomyces sp. NPDC051597 TaxID=3155049 RepID=UPI0034381E3A
MTKRRGPRRRWRAAAWTAALGLAVCALGSPLVAAAGEVGMPRLAAAAGRVEAGRPAGAFPGGDGQRAASGFPGEDVQRSAGGFPGRDGLRAAGQFPGGDVQRSPRELHGKDEPHTADETPGGDGERAAEGTPGVAEQRAAEGIADAGEQRGTAGILGLGEQRAAAGRPGVREQRAAEARLARVARSPGDLDLLLRELPKGGDLHHHLGGAVPPESLLAYAARDRKCVDTTTYVVVPRREPCVPGQRPARDAARPGPFRGEVVRAWSMRGSVLPPDGDPRPGHDHFFATFGKFAEAEAGHDADMLAEVARAAARERTTYVETLVTVAAEPLRRLVDRVHPADPGPSGLAGFHRVLTRDPRFEEIVRQAGAAYDQTFTRYRRLLGCGRTPAPPACSVVVRFDYQVGRAQPARHVFAQEILGFALAHRRLGRVVGVNLVQPEDDPVALRDYTLHMRMTGFLKSRSPSVHVSLHAGELVAGLDGVRDRDLAFHIAQAVGLAGAERVGHGVDLLHERGHRALAARMRERHVLVEAPLSSHAQILRVTGDRHPLHTYLDAGVPLALATDDPGVSGSGLTDVYRLGVTDQGLDMGELRTSARASLDHAFVEGANLWREQDRYDAFAAPCRHDTPDPGHPPGAGCRAFLAASPKAALQWRLETDWRAFGRRGARR